MTAKPISDFFALPLRLSDDGFDVLDANCCIVDDPDDEVRKAILRAINCHDELVAALRKATDKLERCIQCCGSDAEHAAIAVEEYRAALAKASRP